MIATMEKINEKEKRPRSEKLVSFQDCDPLGHLNNAKYIHYFMNAREDHMVEYYGENLYEIGGKSNGGWVVAKNEISYLYPAIANERLIIETALISLGKKNMVNEAVIYDKDRTHIKVVSWVHFTFVNKLGRPISHSEELQNFLESILDRDALFGIEDFDTRIATLRKKVKEEKRNRYAI